MVEERPVLSLSTLAEYLGSVGVADPGNFSEIRRLGGKNAVFRAFAPGISWIVKQFFSKDSAFDPQGFERELSVVSVASPFVLRPEVVDEGCLALVYEDLGDSLGHTLRSGAILSAGQVVDIGGVVENIRHLKPNGQLFSVAPPVVSWLVEPRVMVQRHSPARTRVLSMIRSFPSIREIAMGFHEEWISAANARYVLHGDIKLEQVFSEPQATRVVDWESVRVGAPGWDHAGLIQSLLVYSLYDWIDWDSQGAPLSAQLLEVAERPRFDVARQVGLRLLQTAIEWQHDELKRSPGIGRTLQLGIRLMSEPNALDRLVRLHESIA